MFVKHCTLLTSMCIELHFDLSSPAVIYLPDGGVQAPGDK